MMNLRPARFRVTAAAVPALLTFFLSAACGKRREVVLHAERKAQIGGEFLRLYDDGSAEYGYGVVSEKLKAEGRYRYVGDTLWLEGGDFRKHFPAGFLVIKEGVVIMESGFHFLVTQSRKVP
jgi:hypothetical protein